MRVDAIRSAWTFSFAARRVIEREERRDGTARGQRLGDVGRDLDGAAEPVRRLGLEGCSLLSCSCLAAVWLLPGTRARCALQFF